jgi:hypothetical protein
MIHAMTDFVAGMSLMCQASPLDALDLQSLTDTPTPGWRGFATGWRGLTDLGVLIPMAASVLTAVLLAFPIAYHPRIYRRAATLEEMEAPKGMIGYSAVSAGIAQIVVAIPAMAFVVFGIGGLYRFRTRAGAPKLIYPTIGVVVIGLACGMMAFPLAVVLAALVWALPFWFESRYAVALQVKNLSKEATLKAVEDYRRVLEGKGGQVVSVLSRRTGEFSIVANVPARVNAADVEAALRALPTEERGVVQWETG